MTRRFARPVWLVLVLMVCLVGSAPAARPESLEVRERGASRGLLTITVMDDGSAYIAPADDECRGCSGKYASSLATGVSRRSSK